MPRRNLRHREEGCPQWQSWVRTQAVWLLLSTLCHDTDGSKERWSKIQKKKIRAPSAVLAPGCRGSRQLHTSPFGQSTVEAAVHGSRGSLCGRSLSEVPGTPLQPWESAFPAGSSRRPRTRNKANVTQGLCEPASPGPSGPGDRLVGKMAQRPRGLHSGEAVEKSKNSGWLQSGQERTSLAVQQLRLCFNCRGLRFNPWSRN